MSDEKTLDKKIVRLVSNKFEDADELFDIGLILLDPKEGKDKTLELITDVHASKPLGNKRYETIAEFSAELYPVYGADDFFLSNTSSDNKPKYDPLTLISETFSLASMLPRDKMEEFYGRLQDLVKKSPKFTYKLITIDFMGDLVDRFNNHIIEDTVSESELSEKLADCIFDIFDETETLIGCAMDNKGPYMKDVLQEKFDAYFPVKGDEVPEEIATVECYFTGKCSDPHGAVIDIETNFGPVVMIGYKRKPKHTDVKLATLSPTLHINGNGKEKQRIVKELQQAFDTGNLEGIDTGINYHSFRAEGRQDMDTTVTILSHLGPQARENVSFYKPVIIAGGGNIGDFARTTEQSMNHVEKYQF